MAQNTSDEERMHAVLEQHGDHILLSGGPYVPKTQRLDLSQGKDALAWLYLGKSVSCVTCGYSLSAIWYDD